MRRISIALLAAMLWSGSAALGQDAATEEKLNQLSGKIEDLVAGQESLRKRIAELTRELESLREQQGKPNNSYVTHEDLKRLAESLKEVDRKRVEDGENTRAALLKLGKELAAPVPAAPKKKMALAANDPPPPERSSKKGEVAEYVVQSGDSLSVIAQAYREKNVKVSVDQILKANPGLVAEKLHVGQKIFVPLTSAKSE